MVDGLGTGSTTESDRIGGGGEGGSIALWIPLESTGMVYEEVPIVWAAKCCDC